MPAIAVITEHDDGHVPLVQEHLEDELIVIDALAGALTFLQGDQSAVVSAGRPLKDVKSVWYRKPLNGLRSLVESYVASEHRRYSRLAIGAHADLLMTSFPDARWISDYFAIVRAESKVLQLARAHKAGLRVPETAVTNDPVTAAGFLAAQPATIIKPLISPVLVGDETQMLLAKRFHGPSGLERELAALRWAPAIFQRAIDRIADLRVTVVGTDVFTARIDAEASSQGQTGTCDWRYDAYVSGRPFQADELPAEIRRGCLALTRDLGLEFAAIDLVIDPAGTIWFLELNPNGQWGFVGEHTTQSIAAAIADLLTRG